MKCIFCNFYEIFFFASHFFTLTDCRFILIVDFYFCRFLSFLSYYTGGRYKKDYRFYFVDSYHSYTGDIVESTIKKKIIKKTLLFKITFLQIPLSHNLIQTHNLQGGTKKTHIFTKHNFYKMLSDMTPRTTADTELLEMLRGKLNQLSSLNAEKEKLKTEYEDLKAQNRGLKRSYEDEKGKVSEKNREIEKQITHFTTMKLELDKAKQERDETKQELDKAKQELDNAKQELDNAADTISGLHLNNKRIRKGTDTILDFLNAMQSECLIGVQP